jgi:hypothetical protein
VTWSEQKRRNGGTAAKFPSLEHRKLMASDPELGHMAARFASGTSETPAIELGFASFVGTGNGTKGLIALCEKRRHDTFKMKSGTVFRPTQTVR